MSRYDLYSTLPFASGRVGRSRTSCASRHRYILYNANRRNRQAITRQRLLRHLKRLLLVFYLRPSMASFSTRLASHKIQRTLQTVQLRILGLIIRGAFSLDAGLGGLIGVLIMDFQRAAFSNEAGIDSEALRDYIKSLKSGGFEKYSQ